MFLWSATQRQEVNSRKADEVFAEDGGPINLGDAINNGRTGGTPSLSSDGDFFFFEANSERNFLDEFDDKKTYARLREIAISSPSHRSGDIFWTSTSAIESLRSGG